MRGILKKLVQLVMLLILTNKVLKIINGCWYRGQSQIAVYQSFVCIFIRVSNPVKTKSRQNKNKGNDFSLSKAAKQSKARQDHYVWVCENNKKVLTTINS